MNFKRPFTAFATLIVASGLALSGCAASSPGSAAPASSTPGGSVTPASSTASISLVTPGTLTVCTNLPFKPMEYRDDNGNVVGFDFDMMGLVAAKLGVNVTPVEIDFAQMTSGAAMIAKKCDISAASITITDARKDAVAFSQPYFEATQALTALTSSGINGLGDLNGKKVAVQTDTTGADYANANSAQYGFQVVVFDDAGIALTNVLSGRVDAGIVDRAIVYGFVADNPTTHVVTEFQTGESYGFAAAKDANGAALISVVDQVLQTAESDGTYLKMYQKWIDPNATSVDMPK